MKGFKEYCEENQYSLHQTRSQAFALGAASRQNEVEGMQRKIKIIEDLRNNQFELLLKITTEKDKLQERIDAVWDELDDRNSKEYIIEMVEKALKGD